MGSCSCGQRIGDFLLPLWRRTKASIDFCTESPCEEEEEGRVGGWGVGCGEAGAGGGRGEGLGGGPGKGR